MPQSYCLAGHRFTYSDSKPEKCPLCNASLNPPPLPVEDEDDLEERKNRRERERRRLLKEMQEEGLRGHKMSKKDLEDDEEEEGFDIQIQKETGDGRPMTVKQLRETSGPIERTESKAQDLQGSKGISAADLVSEMLKDRPQQPS